MFVFKKNMIYINKLSPTVKLPFKEVKGSINYRQSKACNMVDKLYREILPQFNKKEEISFAQAKKALKNVLKGQIDIPIRKTAILIFLMEEVIFSTQNLLGKYQKQLLTLELLRIKLNV